MRRSEYLMRCCVILLLPLGAALAQESQIVSQWAERIGDELWELANIVTRPDEILNRYRSMNVRVETKSGEELRNIISESVGRMLRRKMDAVRCILQVAEDAAEQWDEEFTRNFTYVSGKYSPVIGEESPPELPENMLNDSYTYREIELEPDSHFYNIPVNTNFSAVHTPTNVYDKLPVVADTIRWSEKLDRVFRHNYKSDPALSWQYFGSTNGVLRHYPAMRWLTLKKADDSNMPDLYDCRVRSWFIEASTCSKDMVILVDNSGSMTGMRNTIAKTTVAAILDTLSNNDFVAVFNYSKWTEEMVPCFKDMLVQATPENVEKFNERMDTLKPDGVANLTQAFTAAFSLLERYRYERGCGVDTPCNQLIMLVTDGIASNITEVFQEWNWLDNGTIPVRVFTYLIGMEITNVREIQWMACLNRGYYTHVHTQAEVREQVLKYISVVARPLVLYGKVHPVVWTHAYADITNPALDAWLWVVMNHPDQISRLEKHRKRKLQGMEINEDGIYVTKRHEDENVRDDAATLNSTAWQEYRLLTSVGIPVFDRKGNRNNVTKKANLLGVAGTDVPLDDIWKLTLPYKLGVNGYAFIVSNNGYVILHPDLRPVYKGKLKLNYNSVDLTEVEILNDGSGPRVPGQDILDLRQALVEGKKGHKKNVSVKLHYDNNRRITLERRDYFYAPLPETPFGIAIVLPHYGKHWIKVGHEIDRNKNVNISDFFAGNNWRVHHGWVYCRYHYLEGHEFDNVEEELRHFLRKMQDPNEVWKWSEQYKKYDAENEEELDCGEEDDDEEAEDEDYNRHYNDYYCNRELMELLVFDAKATNQSYMGDFKLPNLSDKQLVEKYEVFLRFIATQSGLTRWQKLNTDKVTNKDKEAKYEFGDLHSRAVNEPWYKGAIFQHEIDPDSISITVPKGGGLNSTVTVSLGIFPRDAGLEAAAAVTGFQMPMMALYNRFLEILTSTKIDELDCTSMGVDCYLIDQNGYVVISEAHNDDAGMFFGTMEQNGPVMQSLVDQGLFHPVDIYDYQGMCSYFVTVGSASIFKTPMVYAWNFLTWFFAQIVFYATQIYDFPYTFADEDEPKKKPNPPHEEQRTYPCDLKRTLYIINEKIHNQHFVNLPDDCALPFHAQRVPHTNLLIVIVKTEDPGCYVKIDVEMSEISPFDYTNGSADRPCHKIPLNVLPRRRLKNCFTEHEDEDEIEACGKASFLMWSYTLIFFSIFILLKFIR